MGTMRCLDRCTDPASGPAPEPVANVPSCADSLKQTGGVVPDGVEQAQGGRAERTANTRLSLHTRETEIECGAEPESKRRDRARGLALVARQQFRWGLELSLPLTLAFLEARSPRSVPTSSMSEGVDPLWRLQD